jgi:hypothetical protein
MTKRVRVYGCPSRIDEEEGRQGFLKSMREYLVDIDLTHLVSKGYVEGTIEDRELGPASGFVNCPITSGFKVLTPKPAKTWWAWWRS